MCYINKYELEPEPENVILLKVITITSHRHHACFQIQCDFHFERISLSHTSTANKYKCTSQKKKFLNLHENLGCRELYWQKWKIMLLTCCHHWLNHLRIKSHRDFTTLEWDVYKRTSGRGWRLYSSHYMRMQFISLSDCVESLTLITFVVVNDANLLMPDGG